ncbi:MAG: type II toxin-antitoxin system HipA family toxin [Propionibacteriaceae bacterium]|jgi:serine/threonine-protein kinase HipA|nr:type II toxin-antitoxin system HipA family toxin [Propionibacteriaceae bacterium]
MKSSPALAVLLYGQHIATIYQNKNGRHDLEYEPDPGATPLSLSMPLEQQHHGHRIVNAFITGLVPDDRVVRAGLGRQFDVSGENPYALLEHTGLDCAGAVQFCRPDEVEPTLTRPGELHPVDDQAIAARLKELRRTPSATWTLPRERWSLGGYQPKIALHKVGDHWAEATGSAPTTHIIKPGVHDLRQSALNEHLCLSTARRLDLPASETCFQEFAGEPAVVITRYDRTQSGTAAVGRLHQEDLCQALGIPPTRKYEEQGGPSALTILDLLARTDPGAQLRFIEYLGFNYLIGAPDCHAKNFSLLLVGTTVRLAPLYDVASGLPYEGRIDPTFAFALRGQRSFGTLSDENWSWLAKRAGLDDELVLQIVHDLAARIPDALRDSFAAAESIPGTSELAARMLTPVAKLCARSGRK